MPNAIRSDSENNRTTGFAVPGIFGDGPGSVVRQVHDGDTLFVRPDGNLGVRLLGIDTPEVSFMFPAPDARFVDLADDRWNEFLTAPFDDRWGPFTQPVPARLRNWIASKNPDNAGTIHHEHAAAATETLRQLISQDMEIMGQTVDTFSYYLNFGFEVMDGYGRLLCIVNRNQPNANIPTRRPPSYNLRLLERGRAFPYFIWPNINPWERPDSVTAAVIPPGQAAELARTDRELMSARNAIRLARQRHLGIFDATNPLQLEPFELRWLSSRELPGRYVIDLRSDSDRMIHPHDYPTVPNTEDRLWLPSEYVPLFEKAGWKVPSAPSA